MKFVSRTAGIRGRTRGRGRRDGAFEYVHQSEVPRLKWISRRALEIVTADVAKARELIMAGEKIAEHGYEEDIKQVLAEMAAAGVDMASEKGLAWRGQILRSLGFALDLVKGELQSRLEVDWWATVLAEMGNDPDPSYTEDQRALIAIIRKELDTARATANNTVGSGQGVVDKFVAVSTQRTGVTPHTVERLDMYQRMGVYTEPAPDDDEEMTHEKLATMAAEFPALKADVARIAREVPTPPLTSAQNVEAALQGFAHFFGSLDGFATTDRLGSVLAALDSMQAAARVRTCFEELLGKKLAHGDNPSRDAVVFSLAWRECGFAKLEIGHKLAANLCLTDIPGDMMVRHPWKAWSLVVPDGLLGDVARVWVCAELDARDVIVIDRRGDRMRVDKDSELANMITSLVQGAALALSNPDDFKREVQHGGGGVPGTSRRRKGGEPDFNQARYMLSAPVKIDMREHVHAALAGQRRGGAPTVQFLVRGHWRNQAHGPRMSLRRQQWIQAFWKGPEESAILLRKHTVEDEKEEDPKKD